MKIKIEVDENLTENELIFRCNSMDKEALKIQKELRDLLGGGRELSVSKNGREIFLAVDEVLFFETADKQIAVHTVEEVFFTQSKLYELEDILPGHFMRVSKSAIMNINKIRSIRKNITGASEVQFYDSNKKAFVSRNYYKPLVIKLEEKRLAK